MTFAGAQLVVLGRIPDTGARYSCTVLVLKRKCIHLSHTITLFQIASFLRRVHGKDPSVSKPLCHSYQKIDHFAN